MPSTQGAAQVGPGKELGGGFLLDMGITPLYILEAQVSEWEGTLESPFPLTDEELKSRDGLGELTAMVWEGNLNSELSHISRGQAPRLVPSCILSLEC